MGSNPRRRFKLPSPAMVVAMVALFVALGGSAAALSGRFSVKQDDIAPNAVTTKKIKAKAVRTTKIAPSSVDPFKLSLTRIGAAEGEISTTSTVPADLGGPNVQVKVPDGGLIAVHAQVAMRATGNNAARVFLYEPSLAPTPVRILASNATADFQTRWTAPGSTGTPQDDGVGTAVRGGWLVFPSTGGVKTFSLRYETSGGTAIFKERRLRVTVVK